MLMLLLLLLLLLLLPLLPLRLSDGGTTDRGVFKISGSSESGETCSHSF
jgi:hypothetical protein